MAECNAQHNTTYQLEPVLYSQWVDLLFDPWVLVVAHFRPTDSAAKMNKVRGCKTFIFIRFQDGLSSHRVPLCHTLHSLQVSLQETKLLIVSLS